MRSPRTNSDTTRLVYTNTKEGESSKTSEQRNANGNKSKPTCNNCGKIGHTTNFCRSKTKNNK